MFSGACKVLNSFSLGGSINVSDFHSPQPLGYHLKTTVEIIRRADMYNFEKKLNEEYRRPIVFNNKYNAVTVRISIQTFEGDRFIDIGNLFTLRYKNTK